MKKISYLLIIFLFFICTQQIIAQSNQNTDNQGVTSPKNIILMIGDGMGISHITAGMYSNDNSLNLERFKVIGLQKTHSADNLITDSAAGGTALSSGYKTYNSAIGMDSEKVNHKTILELAEENGLASGLVATSTIVHATPASFIAHQPDRYMYEAIATDFLKDTEVDIFIGGGQKYFDNRTSDKRNLITELKNKGYYISNFETDNFNTLEKITANIAFFTADNSPKKSSEGRKYLPDASKFAVEYLDKKNNNGFFIMIEGSQIDWGGHDNDSDYIITEMIDFDNAIGKVLDFAEKDGETLVIVTADHECGGYGIITGSEMNNVKGAFLNTHHTATMVPVFAYGPGSDLFAGIYENTDIYSKMREAFGF